MTVLDRIFNVSTTIRTRGRLKEQGRRTGDRLLYRFNDHPDRGWLDSDRYQVQDADSRGFQRPSQLWVG
ncbi:hypothetical protein H6F78_01535 [Coleofasciculus sp. FACHB-64]|uniref:hypothetical protein n=1 Tax=Cyanophyceae TaxID=3028117 RepID=UPI0016869112|nr:MULTISPECIES: hypothetical protein [unclassified Coleofasciculus]MBD1840657.1 hypothetical protein [Coleofasciculus sp. FACHB-501]MBD2044322.1 hypothetical protein [Coleofasciculus sp. FACHB-64]